jgi:hypothetical protein
MVKSTACGVHHYDIFPILLVLLLSIVSASNVITIFTFSNFNTKLNKGSVIENNEFGKLLLCEYMC